MFFFRGKNFSFELNTRTYVMGILNVTPDSFYDGGKWNSPGAALNHALQLQNDGADIIDIGAQSTGPGHKELSEKEELSIIKEYIDAIIPKLSVPTSVDTFYPAVAEYCLMHGVAVVNDVSGRFNPDIASLVKNYNAGWIVMHTGGGDADRMTDYEENVVGNVNAFFDYMLEKSENFGIKREQICLDMGIGFGKDYEDNLTLIKNIKLLKRQDVMLLTALSNKRVIKAASHSDAENCLFGTIAADTAAVFGGTDMIRVHEVKESKIAADMADAVFRG